MTEKAGDDTVQAQEEWACVEIFGHRKHYGRIAEAERYGAKMLRVDVPLEEEGAFATFFYAGSAIFSVTPLEEEAARRMAVYYRPRLATPLALAAPHDVEEVCGRGVGALRDDDDDEELGAALRDDDDAEI